MNSVNYNKLSKQDKKFIKKLSKLPKDIAHKELYKFFTKQELNLENPKDFNEKIHYLIVNRYGQREGEFTDRLLAHAFVKHRGYEDILPKLYEVYKSVGKIKLDKLPDRFVLKPNHLGNGEGIVFCDNKEKFKLKEVKKALKRVMKEDYSERYLEYQYKTIKHVIYAEEYLDINESTFPNSFKFYCFHGKVECIEVRSDEKSDCGLSFFDVDWKFLDYTKPEYKGSEKIKKPESFNDMLQITSDLCQGFDFVVLELFDIKGQIYFSKLTFSPASGFEYKLNDKALMHLGDLIKL